MRWHYQSVDKKNSGVGVLDKAVRILAALEAGPQSLSDLVATTAIARPTAHRLAVALEHHRLVSRDFSGRFVLGTRSAELAAAAGEDKLLAIATPALTDFEMQLVRAHSSIAGKVIYEFVLQLQSD